MLYNFILYFIFLIISLFSINANIYTYTPTSTHTPTPISIPTATPTPVVIIPTSTPVITFINTWRTEEKELIRLLNEYRGDILVFDENLTNAARWMSNNMYINNRFSHIDSLGRDTWERLASFGWGADTFRGENLAKDLFTASTVFNAWKVSPAHNSTMLTNDFTRVGIANVDGYWTLLLGNK